MSLVQIILLVVVLAAVGFVAAQWLFKKDTEVENRRRGAAHLAGVLQNLGLKKLPEFLISYSVGDYSGMAKEIGDTARVFLDGEEAVTKEFAAIFDRVLDAKLGTKEGRALIAAKLGEAEKSQPPEK